MPQKHLKSQYIDILFSEQPSNLTTKKLFSSVETPSKFEFISKFHHRMVKADPSTARAHVRLYSCTRDRKRTLFLCIILNSQTTLLTTNMRRFENWFQVQNGLVRALNLSPRDFYVKWTLSMHQNSTEIQKKSTIFVRLPDF